MAKKPQRTGCLQSYTTSITNSYRQAVNQSAVSTDCSGISLSRSSNAAAAAALQKLAEAAAVVRANYCKAGELAQTAASQSPATDTTLDPATTPPTAHIEDLIRQRGVSQHAVQQPLPQQQPQGHTMQCPQQQPRQLAISGSSPGPAFNQQAPHAQVEVGDVLVAVLSEPSSCCCSSRRSSRRSSSRSSSRLC